MISLKDSSILNVLPKIIVDQPEIQALAYALNKQINKVMKYADDSRTWCALETLPEKLIDIMALELRTMYYDEQLPLETKRLLVMNTINIYKKLGTPSAVRDMVAYVCGNAEIEEWWKYGAAPYFFRVFVNDDKLKEQNITYNNSEIIRLINTVKNTRSWLDYICYYKELKQSLFFASAITTYSQLLLNDKLERNFETDLKFAKDITSYTEVLLNTSTAVQLRGNVNVAGTVVEREKEVIY